MIDKETVDKILDTADIVDVVSDFVHLRRRGANYIGLCPFHNEKTPSFSVSRAKGICKCFSCGKGGSAVNFIMEHEQLSYYEALKYLANKYHIEVKERELSDKEKMEQSERENMLVVNEFAMKQFEKNLFETEEGRNIGLSYFYERCFSDSTIKKFHLGYSLETSTALYEALKRNGLNPQFAIESGLCIKGDRGVYDRFKGRVMFPVLNIAGKVIAFGGRTLKKSDHAKYVNSPESQIYKKSNELYGLFQAKREIVNKDKCFLVEGYTDVISMHQSGIENVVASSGTSLTEGQIRMIHRFTENVTILYDGDAAGIKASLRGIDLLLAEGLNIKVLLLPDNDDPDSFAKKHSASEFQDYISKHETDFIRFKTDILLSGLEDDPIKKSEAINDIVKSISVIPSNITRAVYIKECSTRFDIDEKILNVEVAKAIDKNKRQEARAATTTASEISSGGIPQPTDNVPAKASSYDKTLKPFEQEVIRYIAKYGMRHFVEACDDSGNTDELTVLEYINAELTNDGILFESYPYRLIYDKALSLLPEYKDDLAKKQVELEAMRQRLTKEGIDNIRMRAENIEELRRDELILTESVSKQIASLLSEYQTTYLEKRLCSDIDDYIRNISIELVSEKHQLSKVHTKYMQIETEEDRLNTLIPLAILGWKDAIVAVKISKIKEEIKEASKSHDFAKMQELMIAQNRLNAIRGQFAKLLGDRVIIPY